ncbi:ATP-binding cassette domain-containing protein [Poseidonibacter antarcticus]|uniref:ATP-binding cassette domain-containing protein n=1 Tax=Poseidonibacter antarcticus TaxID=2478538 RepID=UPI000EF4639D|nr:ATP-binding cassette domain-containing protein [Poseidonibacter antarcticus]
MLEINNYNSNILSDITFSLKTNENLIILGENGAGKSTLAKVLSNLIENNNVNVFNQNISDLSDNKRSEYINYIPPKLSIFDEYITLREFFELACINQIDNKKIDDLINILNLEKLEHKHCKAFSSGEKQLLLLGSSIMHNAKITIFDELTANLDISRLKEVFDIFKANYLQQKIVITHNLDLAYALKYKVLYMKDGKILFFGENDEFFSTENLKRFYNNSIQKVNEHLVVNL